MARKTYNKKKTTTKRKVGSKGSKPSKAQLKSFMASILEKKEVQDDEGKKSKSQGRRAGL